MGSFENENYRTSEIYDLSMREIDLVLKKLEADNMNLRRELHESRVKLNDKDEEILKLQRALLSQKKETLFAHRKIMAMTDEFKIGQVQSIIITRPKEEFPVPSMTKMPTQQELSVTAGVGVDYIAMSACSVDDEQHVKAPFNYQYRHLKLQPLNNNSTTISIHEDEKPFKMSRRDSASAAVVKISYEC